MTATTVEERIAVLEAITERNLKDTQGLFKILREHMDKEDKDREVLRKVIKGLAVDMAKMKGYLLGGVFIISIVWTFVSFVVRWQY